MRTRVLPPDLVREDELERAGEGGPRSWVQGAGEACRRCGPRARK